MPAGDIPLEKRELINYFTGASVAPQDIYFAEYGAEGNPAFTAVNAIPFYLAMGKVTNTGASDPFTHKIEKRDLGTDLPSFTHRNERYSSAAGRYDSLTGNYVRNLTYAHDFSQLNRFSTYQMLFNGTKRYAPQFAGQHTTGPVIPGSHDKHYMQELGTFAVKWDATFASGQYSTGGDDLSTIIQNFQLIVNNNLVPEKPAGQDYPSDYIMGRQNYIASFDILDDGTGADAVYDDFITMQDNSTKKNMHYKIYQSATHYLQLDMENFMLGKAEQKFNYDKRENPVIRCSGLFTDLIVQAVDPLAGATYYV